MSVGDTRWAIIWEMADGEEDVKARLVTKGHRGPDLEDSSVDTAGCGSLRSPHIQVTPHRSSGEMEFLEHGRQ